MTSRRGSASRIALDRKFDNIRLTIFSTKVELMSADDLAVCRAIRALSEFMQTSGVPPHVSQWRWTCSFYGKPGGDSGSGVDLDDCKAHEMRC